MDFVEINNYASVFEVALGLNAVGATWRALRERAILKLEKAGKDYIDDSLVTQTECYLDSDGVKLRIAELNSAVNSLTSHTTLARKFCLALAFISGTLLLLGGFSPTITTYEYPLFIVAVTCLSSMPSLFLLIDLNGKRKLNKLKNDCDIMRQGAEATKPITTPNMPNIKH